MENSKFLVPVLLSIIDSYKQQAENVLKELKHVECALSSIAKQDIIVSEKDRSELIKQIQRLKSDLAEKEEILQGFSDIYESRMWPCSVLTSANMSLH